LRDAPGRDILAINSASIIQALLRAGLIDDLRFAVVPALLGGGLRLFAEGLPASAWTLTQATILEDGAIGLHYSRAWPTSDECLAGWHHVRVRESKIADRQP